jgi:hypothetical protein
MVIKLATKMLANLTCPVSFCVIIHQSSRRFPACIAEKRQEENQPAGLISASESLAREIGPNVGKGSTPAASGRYQLDEIFSTH